MTQGLDVHRVRHRHSASSYPNDLILAGKEVTLPGRRCTELKRRNAARASTTSLAKRPGLRRPRRAVRARKRAPNYASQPRRTRPTSTSSQNQLHGSESCATPTRSMLPESLVERQASTTRCSASFRQRPRRAEASIPTQRGRLGQPTASRATVIHAAERAVQGGDDLLDGSTPVDGGHRGRRRGRPRGDRNPLAGWGKARRWKPAACSVLHSADEARTAPSKGYVSGDDADVKL